MLLRGLDKLKSLEKELIVDKIRLTKFNFLGKHVVHKNVVGGSIMIRFPLVIAVSEWDMPGIKPGPLGWHTSALTNELQEARL